MKVNKDKANINKYWAITNSKAEDDKTLIIISDQQVHFYKNDDFKYLGIIYSVTAKNYKVATQVVNSMRGKMVDLKRRKYILMQAIRIIKVEIIPSVRYYMNVIEFKKEQIKKMQSIIMNMIKVKGITQSAGYDLILLSKKVKISIEIRIPFINILYKTSKVRQVTRYLNSNNRLCRIMIISELY